MKKIITILLLISLPLLSQQLSKVYVLSEGGFSAGSSMLSMLDIRNENFTKSIFNPGDIGLYPDGLIYYNEHLYLTEQGSFGGSGKIYKLDTLGVVINSEVVGTNPYSLAVSNDKVYITNGPASNVSVLNISDFSLVKNVTVGVYPQEIIAYNNKVFVANNSLFGGDSDSTVSVINSETDEVIHTIVVRRNPSSLALTNDNHLLIGCPGDETSGIIFKVDVNTFAKVDSFTIGGYGFGKDIFVDKNSDKIFFKASTNDIVEFDLVTNSVTLAVSGADLLFTYGYGYDYINETHYLLDAKDFVANGSLTTYNNEGALLNTYETSIAPRRVVFKYVDRTTSVNDEIVAKNFVLKQNFPNPFNPSTTIRFSIPEQSSVKLRVFNTIGQQVAELINQDLDAGDYEKKFNASELSSGIYYYTIQAGDFVSTRKMMLIK